MANVSTIQASGGDYADIDLWEADVQGTLSTIEIGECANEAFTDNYIIAGSTTTSSAFMRLTHQTGARHDGTPASGARIISGGTTDSLIIQDQYTEVIGIEIAAGASQADSDEAIDIQADDVLIDSCLLRDFDFNDGDGIYIGDHDQSGLIVQNCIIHTFGRAGIHVQYFSSTTARTYSGGYFANNTIYNCGTQGNSPGNHSGAGIGWRAQHGSSAITLTLYNNIVDNNKRNTVGPVYADLWHTGDVGPNGTITLNGSHNITDEIATSSVTNNLTNGIDVPRANISDDTADFTSGNWVFFVDLTASQFDLHLQSDSNNSAEGAGVGPSTQSAVPTLDIDGNTRSGTTCDIGSDEISTGVTVALNTLSLTGAAVTLSVTPGAVEILLNSLNLTSNAETLTVTPGAVATLLNTLSLSASPQSLSVTPGAVAVLLNSLSLASSAETLTVTPGAVAALLNTLSLASSAETLTVTPGAVAALLNTLSLTSSAETLTVTIGVTVSLNTLNLTISAETLTVTPGAIAALLNTLSLTSNAEALTVTPGAIAALLNTLSLTSNAETLGISSGVAVLLNSLSLSASPQSLSVTPGAIAALLNTLSLTSNAETLTVTPGAVATLLNTLSLTSNAETLTVTPGAIAALLNTLSLSASPQSLSVTPGAVAVLLNSLNLTISAETLNVVADLFVTLNTLSLTSSAETLNVVADLLVTLNTLSLTSNAESLGVLPGEISVLLNTINLLTDVENINVTPGAVAVLLNSLSLASSAETLDISLILVAFGLTLRKRDIDLTLQDGR